MRSYGDQGALPAQVLVELVLQVDEAFVAVLVECHPPQDCADYEWPHQRRLWLDNHPLALSAWLAQADVTQQALC